MGWVATLLQRESKTEHLAKGSRRMRGNHRAGEEVGGKEEKFNHRHQVARRGPLPDPQRGRRC